MSYKFYVTKRAPVSSWILDDTVPFQEYTGFGASGGKKSGSGDPTKGPALVAGAAWSSVFKSTAIGQFACPLFKQGLERRPFALETWVLPIPKTSGFDTAVTNTAANPSAETLINGFAALATAPETTIVRDATFGTVGTASAKLTKNTDSTGAIGCLFLGSATSNTRAVTPGKYVRTTVTVKNNNATAKDVLLQHYWFTAALGNISNDFSTTFTIPANTTQTISYISLAPALTAFSHSALGASNNGSVNMTLGDSINLDAVIITIHNTNTEPAPPYFDGSYPGATWAGTAHLTYSTMAASYAPQQILSHDNVYDGLTIEGKVIKFSTDYLTSGSAACDYDLQEYKRAHVVAIHNEDQNQLWVNGKLVASVDITDAQKADLYTAASTGNLFSGLSTSSQEIAMNGVAFYSTLSGDQIKQNYEAGIKVISQDRVAPQLDGDRLDLDGNGGSIFLEESWITSSDFKQGYKNNVEIAPDQIEPAYSGGVSVPGSWIVGMPLDSQGDTSVYGVMVQWSGKNVDVDVSLDGLSWAQAYNGQLISIVPNAYNPTGKDLQIRVSFAGGLATDPAYLESLHVIGFRDNVFANQTSRTVTASYPAVLRGDFEPIEYRDDNGVNLHGGTLTIGTDTSAEPKVARTLELWIKPISGTITISVGGTKYRNGVADSTLPQGEWSLIHYVAAADIATSITVTGDCIVGQAVLYPTALSASEVDHLYKSYTGVPVVRFSDSNAIGITESNPASSIYTHDWSISGAG